MPTRLLEHPQFEVEEYGDEDILIRFRVPGSKFGPVEIVLAHRVADELIESVDQALAFTSYQP